MRKLGAALARHTGQDEGEAVHHLWGRPGVLLHAEGDYSNSGEPHSLLSPTTSGWCDGVNPIFFSHLLQYLLHVRAVHCL